MTNNGPKVQCVLQYYWPCNQPPWRRWLHAKFTVTASLFCSLLARGGGGARVGAHAGERRGEFLRMRRLGSDGGDTYAVADGASMIVIPIRDSGDWGLGSVDVERRRIVRRRAGMLHLTPYSSQEVRMLLASCMLARRAIQHPPCPTRPSSSTALYYYVYIWSLVWYMSATMYMYT